MPFSRPDLPTLINRAAADVAARLPRDQTLRWDDSQVYARVLAGQADGIYGYLDYIARQVIYDTAEGDYLLRWASIWGIEPLPAVAATGTVTFTVAPGAVIGAGEILAALDGVQYQTVESAIVSGSSATAPISAVAAGEAGNRITGAPLTLVTPIAGVESTATAGALTGGADAETIDATRARFLARIRDGKRYGKRGDYVAWALEVPGVTRAWEYPLEMGAGSVTVRFVRDDDDSLIPDDAELATVHDYIAARCPVRLAALYVVAPVPVTQSFALRAPVGATSAQLAQAEAEIAAIVAAVAPGGNLYVEQVNQAVTAATGVFEQFVDSPSGDVSFGVGELPVMGTVAWT
jgi:uncharacterized phage protein gp47/JayE